MDSTLNAPEHILEIVERELHEAEYYQVLDCDPDIENDERQYGVAIPKRRTHQASRTGIELINKNATQSDDSGTVATDRGDTNKTKEIAGCSGPMVVRTKVKEADVSDYSKSVNRVVKKNDQSTSSSNISEKTGNGKSKKVNIAGSAPKVAPLEAADSHDSLHVALIATEDALDILERELNEAQNVQVLEF